MMNSPKDKAKELVDEYYHLITRSSLSEDIIFTYKFAKQCAIICAESIIDELHLYSDLESIIIINDIEFSVIQRIQFYNSVKEEIEKL